jgi:hypothetical protein
MVLRWCYSGVPPHAGDLEQVGVLVDDGLVLDVARPICIPTVLQLQWC